MMNDPYIVKRLKIVMWKVNPSQLFWIVHDGVDYTRKIVQMLDFIVAQNEWGLDQCDFILVCFVLVSIIAYFVMPLLCLVGIDLLGLNIWLIARLYCSGNYRSLKV
jgi:hypothetical protein